MKRVHPFVAVLAAVGFVSLLNPNTASAQFTIPWFTIDGGGGTSAGGSFQLTGTIGQHDAGTTMTGGSSAVTGGFWAGSDGGGIILGDLNGDGVVNLLDIAPFVNAVTTGTFIPEADINGDGVVNLLDVAPFVNLLTGG